MISDSKLLASAAWDAQSLNELKAKAGEDPAANIRPVARQVEGMFVQMMLKSMRDALPKDGLFSSEHTRLYTSMYDQQIAQAVRAVALGTQDFAHITSVPGIGLLSGAALLGESAGGAPGAGRRGRILNR